MNPITAVVQRALVGLACSFVVIGAALAESNDGTWRLVKRQLSDGTVISPPGIAGMSTAGNGLRHINVFWHTPDGKVASFSLISKTKFGSNDYTESVVASAYDDGSGKPIVYSFPGETKSVKLTREGGKLAYQLPFDPPRVEYDGDKLTATFEGVFVDYWERAK